jgi:hypothetical protein
VGDRWGPEGPPTEAYSRVTRDLAQVTAGFAAYLDELPSRLVADYDCRVRPLTDEEAARVARRDEAPWDDAYAVVPADAASATLLVARSTYDGGATLTIGFGRATTAGLPGCFCDACDEDSDGLIEQTREYLDAATGGVTEFRRPHVPRHPGAPLADGPWLEQGFRGPAGSSASASAEVRGELFEVTWRPWTRRR